MHQNCPNPHSDRKSQHGTAGKQEADRQQWVNNTCNNGSITWSYCSLTAHSVQQLHFHFQSMVSRHPLDLV
jgi:hypothetical protein